MSDCFWIRPLLVQEPSCKCILFSLVFSFHEFVLVLCPGVKLFLVSLNSLFDWFISWVFFYDKKKTIDKNAKHKCCIDVATKV